MKWIKLLQTPFPLGLNDTIYHEGNISKMPDFDAFFLLECRKRKTRALGIRKNGNYKRKNRANKRANNCLSKILKDHSRHSMLSFLGSLAIIVLCSLDSEVNKFYDHLYEAVLLTRCYTPSLNRF